MLQKGSTELTKEALRFIKYLSFKMDCARQQEELGWDLDLQKAIRHRDELERIVQEKTEELLKVMPPVRKYKKKNKPKVLHKQDGELSSHGKKWFLLLKEMGLPESTKGPIEVFDKYEEPKPSSPQQVKDWLFSLGWEPCTFDYKREDDGSERMIPQVRGMANTPNQGLLTDSVVRLIEEHPEVEVLDGLTVANHRKAIFQSMIDSCITDDSGRSYVRATIAGITNTLRFKHSKPLVNLPGVDKPWGKEVRGCLKAPDGMLQMGVDLVSLENTTKNHWIKPLDPEYVAETEAPGYDPHMKLLVVAGDINQEDYDFYTGIKEGTLKLGENSKGHFELLDKKRKPAKTTNYSSTYKVGPTKLSRTTGKTVKECKKLLKAFWDINWSVEKVAEGLIVKEVDGEMWVWNEVSGFWLNLRYDKDRFSTLNQSTGVFVFDTFLAYARNMGLQSVFQSHDEFSCIVGEERETVDILDRAIAATNKRLNLNVEVKYDVNFGKNYAEVH